MIIDIHNHISSPGSPYALPSGEYITAMDEAGIDRAVILGKDYGALGDSSNGNLSDELVAAFVAESPERFVGFTAAHPDRAEAENVTRLEKAVRDRGMRGVKLNPASGFYPNDRRLYSVYKRAEEMEIPVVVHAGLKPPSEGSRLKYCHPMWLDDVVVDFPRLKLIIAHAAYPWTDEAILVALYAENVFCDISTLNQVEGALGWEVVNPVLCKLHQSLGAGKIVFGSDGIFNFEPLLQAVREADFLTDGDRERILCKNAMGVLNL